MVTGENINIQCGDKIGSLIDMHMIIKEGCHGKLVLRGYLSDSPEPPKVGEKLEVTYRGTDEGTFDKIFCGLIQEVHIFVENGVRQVILSATTVSIKLDVEEISRSFQNVDRTYKDIALQIVENFQGKVFCEKPLEKVSIPMLQYKETNWQFLNRLAGYMGLGLFSDETMSVPKVWLGIPKTGRKVKFREDSYKSCLDEEYYHDKGELRGSKPDFLYYQVESGENYSIGDYCSYKGQIRYIFEKQAEWKNGALIFYYKVGGLCHFRKGKKRNDRLSGAALPGVVVKTDREKVYLRLEIDGSNGKALYPYPWSPATGNLLYGMPQTGTKVFLYFPDDHEERAFVRNAMLENEDGKIPSSVQNRIFDTEHGKSMELFEDRIALKGGMTPRQQVLSMGKENFKLAAGNGKLSIIAGGCVSFEAPRVSLCTPLEIKQMKNSQYSFGKSGDIKKKGSRNPATGGDASLSMQYEFNGLAEQELLYATEYEEYIPFDDAPAYDIYYPVGVKILAGALVALAVGVAVGALVFLAAPAVIAVAGVTITASQAALAAGAITVAAGICAVMKTAAEDDGNTSIGEYMENAFKASAEVGGALVVLALAPYAAEEVTSMLLPAGMAPVKVLGHWITMASVEEALGFGMFELAGLDAALAFNDVKMFFMGEKELWEDTGNELYDSLNDVTNMAALQILFLAAVTPGLWQNANNNLHLQETSYQNPVIGSSKPTQMHHYATNKNQTYTSQFKKITDRYGLDLAGKWNKELLPHQGRHPNAYHDFVLDQMQQIDVIADGDKNLFLELFEENIKSVIRDNPEMLYKNYWLNGGSK